MVISKGRVIITLVAVFTCVGAFLADYNATHIFNPLWMPHAKFHSAHTIMLGLLLGSYSLFNLWIRKGDSFANFQTATFLASVYWITQACSILFPNTEFFDPGMEPAPIFGLIKFNQARMDAIILLIVGVGYYLEYSRVKALKGR